MSDMAVVLYGMLKIIKYFFPAVVFAILGLIYLAYSERKEAR